MKRILRDVTLLLAFCAAFYGITVLINWLGARSSPVQAEEFSFDRRKADQFVAQRDWAKAAIYFENLTREDPFNGHAWYWLGFSHYSQQFPFFQRINRELRKSEPDQQKIDEWKRQAEVFGRQAIPAFERAVDFARYRNLARFRLARIHAYYGETDRALEYLREAVDDNFHCTFRGGLRSVMEFQEMRDLSEFQAIVKTERQNQQHRLGRRPRPRSIRSTTSQASTPSAKASDEDANAQAD